MGGVGFAEQWDGNTEDPEHERETHLRLEGPAVRDLQGGFLENWTEGTSALLSAAHFPDLHPGSSNFENRSLSLNDEINLSIQHANVVAELEQHFRDDLKASQELDPESWNRRSPAKRAREYAAELIRQSL